MNSVPSAIGNQILARHRAADAREAQSHIRVERFRGQETRRSSREFHASRVKFTRQTPRCDHLSASGKTPVRGWRSGSCLEAETWTEELAVKPFSTLERVEAAAA